MEMNFSIFQVADLLTLSFMEQLMEAELLYIVYTLYTICDSFDWNIYTLLVINRKYFVCSVVYNSQ